MNLRAVLSQCTLAWLTDDVDALKAEVASLKDKNSMLEELQGLSREELTRVKDEATKKLIATAKEVTKTKAAFDAKAKEAAEAKAGLDEKKTELEDALAYKSEELNDSQEIIDGQEKEIDTLKDLIYKYQVDLTSYEVMFMFTGPRAEEDIDIDTLWDRTIAHIAATRRSLDEAVAAAVQQYNLP